MSLPAGTVEQLRDQYVCRGSFMLGTACGTCSRCKQNLEEIKRATGMALPETVQAFRAQIESLETENQMLRRRVESLEGVTK